MQIRQKQHHFFLDENSLFGLFLSSRSNCWNIFKLLIIDREMLSTCIKDIRCERRNAALKELIPNTTHRGWTRGNHQDSGKKQKLTTSSPIFHHLYNGRERLLTRINWTRTFEIITEIDKEDNFNRAIKELLERVTVLVRYYCVTRWFDSVLRYHYKFKQYHNYLKMKTEFVFIKLISDGALLR